MSKLSKAALRQQFATLRDALTAERRSTAAAALTRRLKDLFSSGDGFILSFSSFRSEIDLSELNSWLATLGRLVLSRVNGDHLALYKVSKPEMQLKMSSWGVLEPDPELCKEVSAVERVLVPGLAFDVDHHRLGYGKGFFDRFIEEHPEVATYGVGFTEQYSPEPLPTGPHDRALTELYLF